MQARRCAIGRERRAARAGERKTRSVSTLSPRWANTSSDEAFIDDYGALMASTELWIATDSSLYRDEALAEFAADQTAWIMGRNPFGVTFMHGFGRNNPPVITALFGHGTNKGGIANGITGKQGRGDGSGIEPVR